MKILISLSAWPKDFFSLLVKHSDQVKFEESKRQTVRGTYEYGPDHGYVIALRKKIGPLSYPAFSIGLVHTHNTVDLGKAIVADVKRTCAKEGIQFIGKGGNFDVDGDRVAVALQDNALVIIHGQ